MIEVPMTAKDPLGQLSFEFKDHTVAIMNPKVNGTNHKIVGHGENFLSIAKTSSCGF